MARYINITVGCDWDGCDQLAPEDDGTIASMTVAVDGKAGREFMLCKSHREQLDEVLLPLMQAGIKVENGTKRSTRTPATSSTSGTVGPLEGYECLACGRRMKNRVGMAQHVIRSHDFKNIAEYDAQYATPSTIT